MFAFPRNQRRTPRITKERIRKALLGSAIVMSGAVTNQSAIAVTPLRATATVDVSKSTRVAAVKDGRTGATFTVYASPDTSKPIGKVVNGKQIFGRAVFIVLDDQEAWLKVRAPIRANGGIGYIPSSIIENRYIHDWHITIDLTKKKLTLKKGDEVVMTETVAVGKTKTPTPKGSFYIVDLVKPKKPTGPYGAFAYGISGFSPVYQTFGKGDGRIGIHGTNEPKKLGSAVSNGCIRMSNAAIAKMKGLLPLGVPVDIV